MFNFNSIALSAFKKKNPLKCAACFETSVYHNDIELVYHQRRPPQRMSCACTKSIAVDRIRRSLIEFERFDRYRLSGNRALSTQPQHCSRLSIFISYRRNEDTGSDWSLQLQREIMGEQLSANEEGILANGRLMDCRAKRVEASCNGLHTIICSLLSLSLSR